MNRLLRFNPEPFETYSELGNVFQTYGAARGSETEWEIGEFVRPRKRTLLRPIIQRVRRLGAPAEGLPEATLHALQRALNYAARSVLTERKGLRAVTSLAPQCVNTKHIISGFPEYAVTPEKLEAEQQAILRRIASEIAASFNTGMPIVAILAVGHADAALRKPIAERAAFERNISQQRAENTLSQIMTELRRLSGATSRDFVSGMQTRAIGVGSTQRLVTSPKTEFERRLNRRVEILPARCALPPPPIPDTFERRITRFLELLKKRCVDPDPAGKRTDRARCILGKILKPGILDVFVDGTASNQQVGKHFVGENLCSWQGKYDPPPLSNADLLKFLGTVSSIFKGPGFAPTVSDEQILKGLSQLIFMINEGIVRVERYITLNSSDFGYTGDKTRGTLLSSIFADHLDDESSIYSCFKDFHGGE